MNSYQKRKQEIKFLTQCTKELEDICFSLAKQLNEANIPIKLLDNGINGDDFLTKYNSGDFLLRLINSNEVYI